MIGTMETLISHVFSMQLPHSQVVEAPQLRDFLLTPLGKESSSILPGLGRRSQ